MFYDNFKKNKYVPNYPFGLDRSASLTNGPKKNESVTPRQ